MSQQVSEKSYKYKAFISYSHRADKILAPALQSGLQKFNTSWNQLYGMRVFRDETDTRISPELWLSIEKALAESEFFMLLASPEAAKSPWVAREVEYWLQNRDMSKFLILVTGGEDFRWDTAPLPLNLKGQLKKEPKYLDLRWTKEGKRKLNLHQQEFYDTVADLAATLQNMDKGVLVGKDARKLRRTKRIAGTAIALLTLLLASTLVVGFIARRQWTKAEAQRKIAEERLARSFYSESALEANYGDKERALLLASEAVKAADPDDPLRDVYAIRAFQLGSHAPNYVRVFPEYLSPVAFNPADNSLFVNGLKEGKIINAAGEETGNYPMLWAASFSRDGRWVVGEAQDEGLVVIDTQQGTHQPLNLAAHTNQYSESAFTSDNSLVVLFGEHRLASAERETGRVLMKATANRSLLSFGRKQLSLEAGREWALAVAPDAPNEVSFIDLRTGKALPGAHGVLSHEGQVISAVFSDDGLLVATSARLDDAHVRLSLWNLTTWQRQFIDTQVDVYGKLKVQEVGPQGKKVLGLIYGGGGYEVASEGNMVGAKVAVWDVGAKEFKHASTPAKLPTGKYHNYSARCVADCSLILLSDFEHSTPQSVYSYGLTAVNVLNTETLRPIRDEIPMPGWVSEHWLDEGRRALWAFLSDQRLVRWDLAESERSESKVYDAINLNDGRFSRDAGSVVISDSLLPPNAPVRDRMQRRYVELRRDGSGAGEKWREQLKRFDGRDVEYFQVGGDQFILVVMRTSDPTDGDLPGTYALQLLDKRSGAWLPESPLESRTYVTAAAFNPNTARLSVLGEPELNSPKLVIKRWDLARKEALPDIPVSFDQRTGLIEGFANDGEFCFAGQGNYERFIIWSVREDGLHQEREYTVPGTSGLRRKYLAGLLRQATEVRLEGQDNMLVTLSSKAVLRVERFPPGVRVFNISRGLPVMFPALAGGEAVDISFEVVYSPDGKWVATFERSSIGNLQVWELDTGHPLSLMISHPPSLLDVVFTQDSESLLTLASDAVVRRWYIGAKSAKKPEWMARLGTMLTGKQIYLAGTSLAQRDEYERLRKEFLGAVSKEAGTDPKARLIYQRLTAGPEGRPQPPATAPQE